MKIRFSSSYETILIALNVRGTFSFPNLISISGGDWLKEPEGEWTWLGDGKTHHAEIWGHKDKAWNACKDKKKYSRDMKKKYEQMVA